MVSRQGGTVGVRGDRSPGPGGRPPRRRCARSPTNPRARHDRMRRAPPCCGGAGLASCKADERAEKSRSTSRGEARAGRVVSVLPHPGCGFGSFAWL